MFEEQVKTIKSLVTYGTLMVPGNAIICKYGWGRDRASRLLFNLLLNSNFSFWKYNMKQYADYFLGRMCKASILQRQKYWFKQPIQEDHVS